MLLRVSILCLTLLASAASALAANNELTAEEQKEGWQLLFDA
ncbi:MAG: hypothetical protein U0894_08005 [Pirellulales bacterium]